MGKIGKKGNNGRKYGKNQPKVAENPQATPMFQPSTYIHRKSKEKLNAMVRVSHLDLYCTMLVGAVFLSCLLIVRQPQVDLGG